MRVIPMPPPQLMENQYRRSFYYPYLLSYDSVLRDMADMGDLLFREYYLELARYYVYASVLLRTSSALRVCLCIA